MGDEYDGVRDTPRMTEDDQSLHVLQEQVVVEQHEEGLAIQSDMVEESGRLEDQRRMTSDPSVDLLLEGDIIHLEPRYEVKHAWSSYEKSEILLGYKENTTLERGLELMWEWVQTQPIRDPVYWKDYELEKNIYSYWKVRNS